MPLYPSGGFASLSLIHSAAEYIRATANGRPVHIIYIGDYDSAGVLIDNRELAVVEEAEESERQILEMFARQAEAAML